MFDGFLDIGVGYVAPAQLAVTADDVIVGVTVDSVGSNHFSICVERNRLLNAVLLSGLLHFLAAA